MPSLPPTQWALLMPNGQVLMGAGDGPNGNVCSLLSEATAAMFCFPGLPRLFICGPALAKCGTDFSMSEGVKQRVWAFAGSDPEGWKLFIWSSGAIIGLGRTQEEVGRAVEAIQLACRRRVGAGDLQRNAR